MKIYRLLMLLLCVHGFTIAMDQKQINIMTFDDIKNKINNFYEIIDDNNDIKSKLNDNVKNYSYLLHSGDYNDVVKSKYIEYFNNTLLTMLSLENKPKVNLQLSNLNDRNLSLLLHRFINFIYKKLAYSDNDSEQLKYKRASELFDELINLRLECASCLPEGEQRNLIVDFSPLALSRWNPFGWGNWYDRLHRTVSSLPSKPWDENNLKDTNKALVRTHLHDIQKNMSNYANSIKPIMQLYVCVMRELRILIKTKLTDTGRSRLRYLGVAGALVVGAGALKYWFGGKKANITKNKTKKWNVTDYTGSNSLKKYGL